MRFLSLDHVGFTVRRLERSVEWWAKLLDSEPFHRGTWLAEETDDYCGRFLGYKDCDMSAAFFSLPGGTVLEMIEYLHPPTEVVDMETYNVGNTHLCLETGDIDGDYSRMKGLAEFRSPEPVVSTLGPYEGTKIAFLRDPDHVSVQLVQFPAGRRAFEAMSPFCHPYERFEQAD